MIDRIAPTRPPKSRVRGYQRWRSLLFLHWPLPVDVLRPLVPEKLEIDTYDGVAYVGVVPFSMLGVRSRWWPKSWALDFLETNVRTYVHRDGQPGVYFLSLDAANGNAVWGAKTFWGLPYFHADMRMEFDGDQVTYETSRRRTSARHHVRYQIGEPLPPSEPASLEFFFLERYLLFVEWRRQLYRGQVHHVPYPAHTVKILELEDSMLAAAGIGGCDGAPTHAHYSPGVDVDIFDLRAMPT